MSPWHANRTDRMISLWIKVRPEGYFFVEIWLVYGWQFTNFNSEFVMSPFSDYAHNTAYFPRWLFEILDKRWKKKNGWKLFSGRTAWRALEHSRNWVCLKKCERGWKHSNSSVKKIFGACINKWWLANYIFNVSGGWSPKVYTIICCTVWRIYQEKSFNFIIFTFTALSSHTRKDSTNFQRIRGIQWMNLSYKFTWDC